MTLDWPLALLEVAIQQLQIELPAHLPQLRIFPSQFLWSVRKLLKLQMQLRILLAFPPGATVAAAVTAAVAPAVCASCNGIWHSFPPSGAAAGGLVRLEVEFY